MKTCIELKNISTNLIIRGVVVLSKVQYMHQYRNFTIQFRERDEMPDWRFSLNIAF